MMNEKEVESLLKETKAILEGHFLLTSGLHSPLYVKNSTFSSIRNIRKSCARNLPTTSRAWALKRLSDRLPAALSFPR